MKFITRSAGRPSPARAGAALAWVLLLAGCAVAPSSPRPLPPPTAPVPADPRPATQTPADPAAEPRPAPVPTAPGPGASLQREAESAMAAGDPDRAATLLERALRLEPRNPDLWLALARARDAEGDAAQAEQLALRAVREAGGQPATQRQAWSFVAALRARRGDSAGAAEARQRAAAAGD